MADIMLPYNGATRGTLPTNTDLDNVTDPGVYVLSSSNTYTNSPVNLGILEVLRSSTSSGYRTQRISAGNEKHNWERFKQGSSGWTDWERIAVGNIEYPTYANGILDYALNVAKQGVTVVSPRNMGYADFPSEVNMYGTAIILKRSSAAISVTIISDSNQYETITNYYSSSTWHGWKYTSGAYCTSQTRWNSLLSKAELHIGFPFSLSGAATDAIFGLGTSYYTNGVVAVNSATSATGYVIHNGDKYNFEYNPTSGELVTLRKDSDSSNSLIQVASHAGANSTSAFTLTFTMETIPSISNFNTGLLVLHKTNVSSTTQDGLYFVTAYLRNTSSSAMSSNKAFVVPILSSASATVTATASTTEGSLTITVTPTVTYMGAVLYKFCGGW